MMLLALAEAKIATENRLRIGPTSILRAALLSGAIDLCPEYTGNAAFFFHEDGDPVWKDAAAGYARATKLDYEKNRLVWLAPAPADNSWVIAVPELLARIQNLRTMEDFARFVRDGNKVKLAASAEFVESAAGLPAFEATLWLPACREPAARSLWRRDLGHHESGGGRNFGRQCRDGLRDRWRA